MISNETQILLTYQLGGESLVKAGVYSSANITVRNYQGRYGKWRQSSPSHFICESGEELTINIPSKTVVDPEYSYAQQTTTLSNEFVKSCLEPPKKPSNMNVSRWLRTDDGKLHQRWKKLSIEDKLQYNIEKYCTDLGGKLISWDLL